MNVHSWIRRPSAWLIAVLLAWLLVVWTIASRHNTGVQRAQTLAEAPPVLGILVDNHMHVVDVDWWSPAKRAGIRRGDILTTLGTIRLPTAVSIMAPDTPLPALVPSTISTTADVRALFRKLVFRWDTTVIVQLDREGMHLKLPVVLTAQAYNYDSTNPPPTVTPVPMGMDGMFFYL